MLFCFRQKFQIFCQQYGKECCPNRDFYCVFAGSNKTLDLEILLEHQEKAFDLPARFIDVTDCSSLKIKVVRQQNKRSMVYNITNDYLSQSLQILFAGTAQINDFYHSGFSRDIASDCTPELWKLHCFSGG